ncbi:hypothetical protein ACLOJK_037484 [Asimina triloba]
MTKSSRKGAKKIMEEHSTKMEEETTSIISSSEEEDHGMIVLRASSLPLTLFAAERKMSEFSDAVSAADMDMRTSIGQLEHLLGYNFRDKTLLVKALTHSSYAEGESYQRLEFVGDAVLGLAITNHIFLTYPDLDPGQLSNLRSANVSTEKLARVAIRHNLYSHLRRHAPALDEKVQEFAEAVRYDADEVPYDGKVKAPKVLADVVESIAAAVYVDCGFDLKVLWLVFRALLEPIVTTETLQQQPVTMLFEFCQKIGQKVDIRFWKMGTKTIANVYVDGKMRGSGWSEQKEIAKLNAAKAALQKLQAIEPPEMEMEYEVTEEGAKQRLNELCSKNRLLKPLYNMATCRKMDDDDDDDDDVVEVHGVDSEPKSQSELKAIRQEEADLQAGLTLSREEARRSGLVVASPEAAAELVHSGLSSLPAHMMDLDGGALSPAPSS